MSWQDVLKKEGDKINPDYKKGKGYRNANPEKQKRIDEQVGEYNKKQSSLKVKQYQAMLRMLVGKHGKDSEKIQELGEKFMASNPTEKEINEIMEYFENLEEKPKPRTPMDELREKQKRAKAELDSKRDKR